MLMKEKILFPKCYKVLYHLQNKFYTFFAHVIKVNENQGLTKFRWFIKKILQSLQHPINNQFNLPTRMLMKKILGSKRIWLCVYVTKWIEDDRTYVSVHKDGEEYIIKNDSVVTLQGKRYKKLKANKLYLIGNASDGPYIKSIKYITCIYLDTILLR